MTNIFKCKYSADFLYISTDLTYMAFLGRKILS